MCGRGYSPQQLPPLAVRIAVVGAVITDPCVPSKPVVKGTARWAVGAAEENRHRAKRRTLKAHAGGNALPRLGAVDNDCAHRVVLTVWMTEQHRRSAKFALIHVKGGRRPVLLLPRLGDRDLNWISLDGGSGFGFKNRMIRESESEPSGEELIALIGALRAENAALKARIAELERLWLPKFRSGRICKMRQNQRIIAFDARDPPLACSICRRSV